MFYTIDHYVVSRWLRLANKIIDGFIIYLLNQSILFMVGQTLKLIGIRSGWITFFLQLRNRLCILPGFRTTL
jgi:hypothetical protein